MSILDADLLRRLRAERFGWLSPDGRLIVCPMYAHFDALAREPGVADIVRAHKAEMDLIAEARLEADGEMHRFDMAETDTREQTLRKIYDAGWIRLGLMRKPPRPLSKPDRSPHGEILEAEGLEAAVARYRRALADIAAVLAADLVARPLKVETWRGHEILVPATETRQEADHG